MITSCETTVQVHGIDIDVRVKYDQDNGRYMAQIYDDKCGEFYPYEDEADDGWWFDSEKEALEECKAQLDNDYVMGCGIFFEEDFEEDEDAPMCPDCDVALIFNDDFECPNCGKCWDPEELEF